MWEQNSAGQQQSGLTIREHIICFSYLNIITDLLMAVIINMTFP